MRVIFRLHPLSDRPPHLICLLLSSNCISERLSGLRALLSRGGRLAVSGCSTTTTRPRSTLGSSHSRRLLYGRALCFDPLRPDLPMLPEVKSEISAFLFWGFFAWMVFTTTYPLTEKFTRTSRYFRAMTSSSVQLRIFLYRSFERLFFSALRQVKFYLYKLSSCLRRHIPGIIRISLIAISLFSLPDTRKDTVQHRCLACPHHVGTAGVFSSV